MTDVFTTESPAHFSERLNLPFKNYFLLTRALTHRSYLNENKDAIEDNERLEYLGDAVLDFIVAEWLYNHFPEKPEGDLTRLDLDGLRRELDRGSITYWGPDKAVRRAVEARHSIQEYAWLFLWGVLGLLAVERLFQSRIGASFVKIGCCGFESSTVNRLNWLCSPVAQGAPPGFGLV